MKEGKETKQKMCLNRKILYQGPVNLDFNDYKIRFKSNDFKSD